MFSNKSFILILLSFLPWLCFPIESAAQLDLSPPPNMEWHTATDDTILIPLILSNPDSVEVDAYTLRVNYSTSLFTFIVTERAGTLTGNWVFSEGQENTPGQVTVAGFDVTPMRESGVLINLKFALTGEIGTATINLSHFVDDIESATTRPGITVVNGGATSVASNPEGPHKMTLLQNYPNPFNPETTIAYELPKTTKVSISIYNMKGELIRILLDEERPTGAHSIVWDGKDTSARDVASGMYLYQMRAGSVTHERILTLLR